MALHEAASGNSRAVVQALLRAGLMWRQLIPEATRRYTSRPVTTQAQESSKHSSQPAPTPTQNARGDTPLHEVAVRMRFSPSADDERQRLRDESVRIAAALLAADADPNIKNETGWAPLAKAVEYSGAAVVDVLIGAGARIEPVYILAMAGGTEDPDALQTLIDAGADVAEFGVRALHEAAWKNGNPEVVDVLLAAGVDIQGRDQQGRNARHHAAAYEGRGAMIRKLAAAGANIEARDRDGNTPLHAAAGWSRDDASGDHAGESISALLDFGANAVQRNGKGQTAWDLAQENEALKARMPTGS